MLDTGFSMLDGARRDGEMVRRYDGTKGEEGWWRMEDGKQKKRVSPYPSTMLPKPNDGRSLFVTGQAGQVW